MFRDIGGRSNLILWRKCVGRRYCVFIGDPTTIHIRHRVELTPASYILIVRVGKRSTEEHKVLSDDEAKQKPNTDPSMQNINHLYPWQGPEDIGRYPWHMPGIQQPRISADIPGICHGYLPISHLVSFCNMSVRCTVREQLFFACALSGPLVCMGGPSHTCKGPHNLGSHGHPISILSTLLGLRDHPRRFAKFRCQASVSSEAWIVGM